MNGTVEAKYLAECERKSVMSQFLFVFGFFYPSRRLIATSGIFLLITGRIVIIHMEVKLLTTPCSIADMENFAALAALTCHANAENEYVPHEILARIIKLGHESILEHITLTYSVKGLSRACLQELSRHRHISLSVESTRHTLRKQLEGDWEGLNSPLLGNKVPIFTFDGRKWDLPALFIAFLWKIAEKYPDIDNDELKYYLPEFWPTNLILTSNIRALRHIIKLRTNPAALEEFRTLAHSLFDTVPEEYRYLLDDCVYREDQND